MTSLRRTVEGWMGDDLYRKLGDEPNIDLTWKLLRDLIGHHLFGSEYVTVPFIESAIYYNQLFVFTKQKSIWSSLGLRPPKFKVVGNLDYLVNRDTSTWIPQFDFSPWDIADGLTMYREYRLRISSNGFPFEKLIELVALDAHVRSAQLPVPGTFNIHTHLVPELNGMKTLYVITDVVFASYVKLSVQLGTRQKSFIYNRDTPIGFRYRKYKLRRDGSFASEMNTTLKFTEKEAQWLLPFPQPVPNIPRWDTMLRRRKMRNNLTIPTPEEPDRREQRAARERDGGVIRLERPVVIGAVLGAREVIAVDNNVVDRDDEWRDPINVRRMNPNQNNMNAPDRRSASLNNLAVN